MLNNWEYNYHCGDCGETESLCDCTKEIKENSTTSPLLVIMQPLSNGLPSDSVIQCLKDPDNKCGICEACKLDEEIHYLLGPESMEMHWELDTSYRINDDFWEKYAPGKSATDNRIIIDNLMSKYNITFNPKMEIF